MPFSLLNRSGGRKRRKVPVTVRTTEYSVQQPAGAAQHEDGKGTFNTIPREPDKLMPDLRPSYRPLDPRTHEIRILKLHPGQGFDPLICKMEHTSLALKQHTPYETVSYCWGDNPGETVIELDRLPAKVTLSAANVIRRMRYPDKYRWLWVDAICINQKDNRTKEKSNQVAIMGLIYRKGWRNLVWLGDDKGHADAVRGALNIVLEDVRRQTADYSNLFHLSHTKDGSYDPLRNGESLSGLSERNLSSLIRLFSCPWFERLWVAQEVTSAHDNLCHFGSATFPLTDILRVAVWLTHNSQLVPTTLVYNHGFQQARMLWYLVDQEFVPNGVFEAITATMISAWHSCQWMEARHAKDNVYALLGMVRSRKPRPPHLHLVPDYDRSDAEVFRDATRIMIEESKSLEMFEGRPEVAREAHGRFAKMPSWVTRFDVKLFNDPGPSRLPYQEETDHNLLLTASITATGESPNVLSLRGIQIDRVGRRTSCMPNLFESNIGQLIHEALHVIHPDQKKPETWTRNFSERFALSLMAGHNWLGHLAGGRDVDDFVIFMEYMRKHGRNPPPAVYAEMGRHDKATQQAMRCFSAIAKACSKRKFFVTAGGRFGLGPSDLGENDIITALYGAALPFALRYVAEGKYLYVGPCYVSGFTEDNALRKHNAAGKRDRVFNLI
ncbi:hypothetical protein M409DRAFT_26823 [Zasmidium cellare ATCC 36951]|uniref:Heterokaryon incompatibility domain-containing protein n=1 Tax=Zasmidium cellare ATCC 36951 TaxID=1080233 RepID=A0A6A6C783_ZASCE|nr:uncharacterized protein M409DRAFT_26823 [Zasmidium cellare ATCC 36951]KAF2162974.1 hypothetical protein M409DRAFT_26823 [Zasmidium cellare ATCC 36951]